MILVIIGILILKTVGLRRGRRFLYSAANDPQTGNDPEPQMTPDIKRGMPWPGWFPGFLTVGFQCHAIQNRSK